MKMIKRMIGFLTVVAVLLTCIPASMVAGEDLIILSDYNDYYGREALEKMPNATELLYAYDNIAACVEASLESASLYNGENYISVYDLRIVIDAYLRDYAHHFWLANTYSYSYIDENRVTRYVPNYLMEGEELAKAKNDFLAVADEILAKVDDSMTDYEKELIIHDELMDRLVYDIEAPNAHNAYGALVEGRTVCEGYAEAFQYLLHRVGINSFLIKGSSMGVGHEWNAVKIDGEYYHVDPTWDDQGDTVFHAYFNVSDEIIEADHFINTTGYNLPVCDSMDANYFSVNGRKVDSDSCTVEEVAKLIKGNMPKAHIYVDGDINEFLEWYGANVLNIAKEIGVVGSFKYGSMTLGREVVLVLDGEVPEPERMLGDVDGDGNVTNADVLEIYRYIYNPALYPLDVEIGDVDGDGFVTNSDVLEIYRYIYNPELYPIG